MVLNSTNLYMLCTRGLKQNKWIIPTLFEKRDIILPSCFSLYKPWMDIFVLNGEMISRLILGGWRYPKTPQSEGRHPQREKTLDDFDKHTIVDPIAILPLGPKHVVRNELMVNAQA